ncbi:glyoxalase superfamily protein [Rhizobium rhizogenes]|jgi:catechol 2,3-dioxygenase-like lactoylglutathione lyase family enzyme|uniref:glyoxalase superfamily protein n=1 Tax=Rhizobium rhizogenes TaxID=359 RepID=UPI0022BC5E5A|nr:glyoxalase superfamily protein [Rhizobium rhizogenes]MCZ7466555.1 glyoxalase superfamily protein [Rhizobium rhizogenes]
MRDAEKHSLSEIGFERTFPIVRIFDEAKAREFYVDFLGFEIDWEHRFGDNFPLYMQVSRAGMGLHLSGHHGDATPGSNIFVTMRGVHAFQQELAAHDYRFMKPGVEELPWGDVMEVTDPFGNRIRFCEQKSED